MRLLWWLLLSKRTRIRTPKFGKGCWNRGCLNRKKLLRKRWKWSFRGELLSFLNIHLRIQCKSKLCTLLTLSLRTSHGTEWSQGTWSQLLRTSISIPRSWRSWSLDIYQLVNFCTKLGTLSIPNGRRLHPRLEQWQEVRCKLYCNPKSDNHCRLEL